MTVLLDTNVVSELVRVRPDRRVAAFILARPNALLSAISVHEIAFGAERAPDPVRAAKIHAWLATMRQDFADNVVEVDWEVAQASGRLRAQAYARGTPVDAVNALVAACAVVRGVAVATRNVRDFAAFGVEVINPWTAE